MAALGIGAAAPGAHGCSSARARLPRGGVGCTGVRPSDPRRLAAGRRTRAGTAPRRRRGPGGPVVAWARPPARAGVAPAGPSACGLAALTRGHGGTGPGVGSGARPFQRQRRQPRRAAPPAPRRLGADRRTRAGAAALRKCVRARSLRRGPTRRARRTAALRRRGPGQARGLRGGAAPAKRAGAATARAAVELSGRAGRAPAVRSRGPCERSDACSDACSSLDP